MTAPVLIITGTDTEVGKTITTAAIAAALKSQGQRVLVIKLVQTGVEDDEEGDAQTVARLADVDVEECVRLPEPLAPDVAAARAEVELPAVADHAETVAEHASSQRYDIVLVEGSGGLLVHLDQARGTLADLAMPLEARGIRVGAIVVARAGLGTLNHTALTLEALRIRGVDLVGVVIGSAPASPGLAEETNVEQLSNLADGQLLGAVPEGAGALDPETFREQAPGWITL